MDFAGTERCRQDVLAGARTMDDLDGAMDLSQPKYVVPCLRSMILCIETSRFWQSSKSEHSAAFQPSHGTRRLRVCTPRQYRWSVTKKWWQCRRVFSRRIIWRIVCGWLKDRQAKGELKAFSMILDRRESYWLKLCASLQSLEGEFDIIFLDADKTNYALYIDIILSRRLLSPRGIILCDNGMQPYI